MTIGFYTNSALTVPFTNGKISAAQKSDGSTGPVDYLAYLGDPVADLSYDVEANPGVEPITVSIVDADVGSGQEATAVKLAASALGLDAAVAGDPLPLATVILSGAANAVEVYIRIEDETGVAAPVDTDLSLSTQLLRKLPV